MIIFCIVLGVFSAILGLWVGIYADKISRLLCGVFTAWFGVWFGVTMIFLGFQLVSNTTYYLEAEPLAYNYEANLTYFTSTEGQFKAEGIYPENTYLLTVDNNWTSDKKDDIVLVVWEPSEGEVG